MERVGGDDMDLIKINGKAFPGTVTGYKGTMIDVDGDGTGTTESGYTIRDVRRRNKSKIMLKLENLTQSEFTEVMTAIDAVKFEVTYFCGYYRTVTVYAGDKNWELIKAKDTKDSRWKLDVNLIEY